MSEKVEDLDVRFERFYAANYPRVKNFAKLLTKSEEDAEDIAQNIFLKLWTRPELWQEQETMTSYLYTVTRNEIFNLFKHQKVEQEYEDKIMKAQMARGADFESGNFIQRIKAMLPILIPLFISAARRANDLALAMDARCYHGGDGRTKMKPLQYGRNDAMAYLSVVLYIIVLIVTLKFVMF